MEKEEILRVLREKKGLSSLTIDTLKFYILILVSARGYKGSIDFVTVQRALGKEFDIKKLQYICESLDSKGLVEVNLREVKDKVKNKDYNIIIDYRLLGI